MVDLSGLDWTPFSDTNSAQALRILLAEDTQISAQAMVAMANHFGVQMDTVENGLDAIHTIQAAQAEGKPYTLLLIDVMMPILDGVETTRRLRDLGFSSDILPIVAVTAATSFDEIRGYRAAGIQAFLSKPVGLNEFKAALEAWGHRTRSRASTKHLAALRELDAKFNERNDRTLQTIDETLRKKTISKAHVTEIRQLLHQIAGTAATFGNPELSKAARLYENALLEPFEESEALRELLEDARDDLKERIAR